MPQRQDDPSAISAVEPLVEAIPGPAVHLRAAGVSVVLVARDGALPSVLHWGHDLGELTAEELAALAVAGTPGTVPNDLDDPTPYGALLPEHSSGWNGRPGLAGSRSGRGWSPRFALTGFQSTDDPAGGGRVVATGADDRAGLTVTIEVELLPSGLVRQRGSVTSTTGAARAGATYAVDGLVLTVPVPPVATELFDLAGRWGRERSPQRQPFVVGVHSRENRRGRTGPDAPLILVAGTAGLRLRAGARCGRSHVAWSGNHVTYAERLSTGVSPCSAAASCCCRARSRSAAGESYTARGCTPLTASVSTASAARFHTYLRARPQPPAPPAAGRAQHLGGGLLRPRPRTGSPRSPTWARRSASSGSSSTTAGSADRRDDTAGLGDWYVDEERLAGRPAPAGRRTSAGSAWSSGCGSSRRWSTPTPTSPARTPTGCSAPAAGTPLPSRNQQVLDLGHPDAYAYMLERLDALLTEYPHRYLKWDHNRDLLDAGRGPDGRPGVHAQTVAVYRLLDELRARHPGVEIESCSSGGAPGRPRHPGAHRPGLGQRLQRPARAPADPALDRPSCCRPSWSAATSARRGRTPPAAPTTSSFRAGTALFGHVRHRVGPHGSLGDRAQGAGLVGRALQGRARAAAHRRGGPRPAARPGGRRARRGRPRPLRRVVRAGPADLTGDLGARRDAAARPRPGPPLPRAAAAAR